MLFISASNRGFILLQFLLLLPELLLSLPVIMETDNFQINYLKDVTEKALKEKPADTIVIVKRRQNLNCAMQQLNLIGIPILRLDESIEIKLKDHFNSEMIALVCMSELADSMLLTTLAKDLHRMREARTIIWLQIQQSALKYLLHIITDHASRYNFLNLIVLHLNLKKNSIIAYRLQPFPSPSLERISNLKKRTIFPKIWLNFKGKTAVILADLMPPHSLLAKDTLTGKPKFYGITDRLIAEFAKQYNIRLRLQRPIDEVGLITAREIFQMTIDDKLDLPIQVFSNAQRSRAMYIDYLSAVEVGSMYIIVPCAKEISIGDVYKGLRTYSSVVLTAYFIFALLETLFVAITHRILRRSYRFSYGNLFVNLSAFCGVLGLPFPIARYRSSLSLQQMVMIMSIFSLIFSCFFNANLSTLLIKQPQDKQIDNYEELRNSKLKVIFDERSHTFIKNEISRDFFEKVLPNIEILPTLQRHRLLFSLNTSYAHHIYTTMLKTLNQFQKHNKRRVLCTSPELVLRSGMIVSGILKHNSIYKVALEDYMHRAQSMGFYEHWTLVAYQRITSSWYKYKRASIQDPTPLSMLDLNWVWKLIGLSYFFAVLVFALEMLIARLCKKRVNRVIVLQN